MHEGKEYRGKECKMRLPLAMRDALVSEVISALAVFIWVNKKLKCGFVRFDIHVSRGICYKEREKRCIVCLFGFPSWIVRVFSNRLQEKFISEKDK